MKRQSVERLSAAGQSAVGQIAFDAESGGSWTALARLAGELARESEAKPDGSDYPLGAELAQIERALRAYATKAVDQTESNPAAAWVIDNYPLLHSTIRDVKSSLPKDFYRFLPRLKRNKRGPDRRGH